MEDGQMALGPRMVELPPKKLVGRSLRMTLANDRTFELWNGFMANKKKVGKKVGTDLYSVQVYADADMPQFGPTTEFTKWAAVEVSDFTDREADFETMTLCGGLYAVFVHKGRADRFPRTMEFIFQEWLPSSAYELDDRPHFELLGEKYRNNDPDSEEEVWVPVKKK
ncbi:GyrI-like domain-containing protein [Pseudozobellia thermophila]|nr:GyrI-like domain-containing protein [Pseudozobellia thermophila]